MTSSDHLESMAQTLDVTGDSHELFAFLTNYMVKPIHPKAMPVILTSRAEVETWLTADWHEAKALQRPLPSDLLEIVEAPAARAG